MLCSSDRNSKFLVPNIFIGLILKIQCSHGHHSCSMTATSDFGSVLVHPGPDVSSRVPNPLDRYLFASALANIDRTPSAARSPGSHRVDEYSHNRIYDPQHPKEISLVDCLFCSDISCACWASFPSTPSSHADSIEAAFQKLVMNAKKDIRQRKFDTLALPPRIKTDIPSLPDTRVPSHTTLLRLWTRDEDLEFPDDILESPDTSCPVTPVDEGWHTSRPARGMPSECSPSECSFGIPLSHRASLRDLDAYYIGRLRPT